MRFGILLGFLLGAAIASLLASSDEDELNEGPTADEAGEAAGGVIEKLKRQAEAARAAAREASEQKQAEMLRDWQQARTQDATDH